MSVELVIYRGLPASGKTTAARLWVAAEPASRVRVNRDDLRWMLHGGYVFAAGDEGRLDPDAEQRVTIARDGLIAAFLERGISVACDDTNLASRYARAVAQIGQVAGATVHVVDMTDVSLEECIDRDRRRDVPAVGERREAVGEDVIRGMYERYLAGGRVLAPIISDAVISDAPTMYVPWPGTPKAVMVDLDGTLCLHDGRSPYDESLVSTDIPNPGVVAAIHAAFRADYQIIFCSGRSEDCREETALWIATHVGAALNRSNGDLLMRKSGDRRRDSIVKLELFDAYIRDRYDVVYVLDDRQQVVDAWREIGLTVFQVAPGQF